MEKVMKALSKIPIFTAILVIIAACGPENGLREETYYYDDSNELWLSEDTINYNFVMTDNHGISQSYKMTTNTYEYDQSWGGPFGINTLTVNSEYHHKSYTSSFSNSYSISIRANSAPFGDEITIHINDLSFRYDLGVDTISDLRLYNSYKSMSYCEDGYESEGESINSKVYFLDNYSTKKKNYNEVLHFVLNDFKEEWKNTTITHVYIAKTIGLIRFDMNNGIYYERK